MRALSSLIALMVSFSWLTASGQTTPSPATAELPSIAPASTPQAPAAQSASPVSPAAPASPAAPVVPASPASPVPSAPHAPASAPASPVSPSPLGQPTGSVAELVEERPASIEEAVRLQVYLDSKNFGPGVIDGKPGRFTTQAIQAYNTSLGRYADDWASVMKEAAVAVTSPYATAIIPEVAKNYVDPTLSYKRPAQAQAKMMSYRSMAEFIAERYHTTPEFLKEINGHSYMNNAGPRTTVKVPNVHPFKIEDLKHGRMHRGNPQLQARHIIVDTKLNMISFYERQLIEKGGEFDNHTVEVKMQLVAAFPITPGQEKFIERGMWNVKNSIELPTWRYDQQFLDTGVRGKEALTIPFGPNNPVGVIWTGLTKSGIGIHGTDSPHTIGRARSAGCIRMANWDAVRVPQLAGVGSVVEIR